MNTNKSNKTTTLSDEALRILSKKIIAKIADSNMSQSDMLNDLIEFIRKEANKQKVPAKNQFALVSKIISTVIVPQMVEQVITSVCADCRGEAPAIWVLNNTTSSGKETEGMYA